MAREWPPLRVSLAHILPWLSMAYLVRVIYESLCQLRERGYSGGITKGHQGRSTPHATKGNDREHAASVPDVETDASRGDGVGGGLSWGRG